jgi:hypothetical protein
MYQKGFLSVLFDDCLFFNQSMQTNIVWHLPFSKWPTPKILSLYKTLYQFKPVVSTSIITNPDSDQ